MCTMEVILLLNVHLIVQVNQILKVCTSESGELAKHSLDVSVLMVQINPWLLG